MILISSIRIVSVLIRIYRADKILFFAGYKTDTKNTRGASRLRLTEEPSNAKTLPRCVFSIFVSKSQFQCAP